MQLVLLLGNVGSEAEDPAALLPFVWLWLLDGGVPLFSMAVESSDWLGLLASLPWVILEEPSTWLPVSSVCEGYLDGDELLSSEGPVDPLGWLPDSEPGTL